MLLFVSFAFCVFLCVSSHGKVSTEKAACSCFQSQGSQVLHFWPWWLSLLGQGHWGWGQLVNILERYTMKTTMKMFKTPWWSVITAQESKFNFAKPARDLDNLLEKMGAQRMMPTGFGDDQDWTSVFCRRWRCAAVWNRTWTSITRDLPSGKASSFHDLVSTRRDLRMAHWLQQRWEHWTCRDEFFELQCFALALSMLQCFAVFLRHG